MGEALVAGGAGFIGSHLCRALLQQQERVLCVDNLSTGRYSNVAELKAYPNFRFLEHDIENHVQAEVKQIFNLACPASPVHYQPDPIKTAKTCVLGTLHLLELAQAQGARLLQASTSEVYGDPEVHPQLESYRGNVNPVGPRSCYDEGKRMAETLCADFRRTRGVDARIVRIFNTYGPLMLADDGRVVSNFVVQALEGKPLTIYGEGQQTRSFCYVSDLVEGLMLAMESEAEEAAGPINLGNPGEFTVAELAKIVIELTQSPSDIQFLPLPVDDPRRRQPQIDLAQKLLGWKPKIVLEDGLRRTISYFRRLP